LAIRFKKCHNDKTILHITMNTNFSWVWCTSKRDSINVLHTFNHFYWWEQALYTTHTSQPPLLCLGQVPQVSRLELDISLQLITKYDP